MTSPLNARQIAAILILLAALSAACRTSPQEKEARFLKRGHSLADKQDYSRALIEFRNASKVMPKDAEPYYEMGLVYLKLRNIVNAATAFHKAVELNPKHTAAQLKLAELMLTSRDRTVVEDAARRMQDLLASAPDTPDAIDTLALAELRLGKADDAAKRLEEALQKFPSHLRTSVELARLRLVKKDIAGAEQVLRKAVEAAPKSAEAAFVLGETLLLAGKVQEGEAEIKRATDLDPRNGPALLALGKLQLATNRAGEAEKTFKRISELPDKQYRPMHAIFLFDQGRRDEAIADFQKLAEQDRDDRAARDRLIAAYMATNKISEAEKVLAAALKRNPKDADALLQRSQVYLRSGKAAEAEKDLREVLRFKADSAEAHFALARVYRHQGLTMSERQELNEVLRIDPRFMAARLTLARSFLQANDAVSALKLLDESPENQKKTAGLMLERNWTLYALGKQQDLKAGIEAVLKVARVPDALLQDALLKVSQKDYAAARAAGEEILKQNPEDLRAASLIGETYAAQKQAAKGTEALRQIAAQHPNSAPLQHLLGQWLAKNGDRAGARQAFEAAKAADKTFSSADLALAEIDLADNQTEAARQRLSNVLSMNARDLNALFLMASAEQRAGNRTGAISRYRSVLDVDSNNVIAMNNMAYLMALDNPDQALKYAQQALEAAPETAAVQDTLGWVYYRKGMYSTAVNYLKNAVAKEPTPGRQFHLGMCYLKAGDQELGQKTVRAALSQSPDLAKTEQGW